MKRTLERITGIEPASSAWKADILAIVRDPHICKKGLRPVLPGSSPTTLYSDTNVSAHSVHFYAFFEDHHKGTVLTLENDFKCALALIECRFYCCDIFISQFVSHSFPYA